MDRRQFIGVSVAGLACTALLVADQVDELKPRDPDLVIDRHGGATAFSPDSKVLAVANGPIGDGQGICFLDADTGKRLPDFERTTDVKTRIGHGRPRVLGFSPNGKYFAAGAEGYVALWDAKNGRRLKNLEPLATREWGTVVTLAFAPDSKYLFAGAGLWPLEPLDEMEELKELPQYEALAFSQDGHYFATRLEGIITLWDYAQRSKVKEFGTEQPTGGPLKFSSDNKRIFSRRVLIDDRPHHVWNVETGAPEYIDFQYSPAFYFDISPDGSLLTGIGPGFVALLNATQGRAKFILLTTRDRYRDNPNTGTGFSLDQRIVASSRVHGVHLWKEDNGFKV
jgi:WD40 repeat protein